MAHGIRWVGLDVHAHESTIAVFDQDSGELTTRRVVGRPHKLLAWLKRIPRPARMVYEAGPTGYVHADLALKENALARTAPTNTPPGRYRPPDQLLAFLEAL